jgi:hypothetical protein
VKELLERYVTALYVSEDQSTLVVQTRNWGDKYFEFPLDADCCSESWYADIVGVRTLLGEQVTGIERLDLPMPLDGRSRQESDEAYGYRLKTQRGYTDIVFRNSSNGYYGGSMCPAVAHDKLPEGMTAITDDWQAPDAKPE